MALELLKEHDRIIEPIFKRYNGSEVLSGDRKRLSATAS